MLLDQVLIIFLSILIFFFLLLIFNLIFKKDICAVCGSVFLSWVLFLIIYYLGYFNNQLILALLIGGTVSGIFNVFKQKLGIFKLPFLLTSFGLGYFLLAKSIDFYITIYLLGLWLIFILFAILKRIRGLQLIVKKILECCRNW